VDLRWLTERLFEGLRLGAAHAVPVALEGPRVMVGPHQAHPLALMLCELYTNSCKHGAHSSATGRVRVRWDPAAGGEPGRVRLRWTESGGPPVRPPGAPGLGLNLIRGFSEYDLHGRCTLRFAPRGVDHVFEFTAGGGAPTRGGAPC
jgi:two-component sensor histidine kinase